jgi:hypothetical protein
MLKEFASSSKNMQMPVLKIPWTYLFATTLSGLGIGVLVGLSASPVVNVLITGVLSLVGGVISGLCGIRLQSDKPAAEAGDAGEQKSAASVLPVGVTPVPIAFLVMSIVLGSLGGLYARTHEWFAEPPEHLAAKWQNATGLNKQEIARRLFDSMYTLGKAETRSDDGEKIPNDKTADAPKGPGTNPLQGVLFAVSEDQCKRLRNDLTTNDINRLRQDLKGIGYPKIKAFTEQCKDDATLRLVVSVLICPTEE